MHHCRNYYRLRQGASPIMISGHHLNCTSRWFRILVRRAPVLAIVVVAFAAKADDVLIRAWPDTFILNGPSSDGFSDMRFIFARSSAVGCKTNCPEWISAEGAITAD
ncbi:MAG: hypothetical protein E5X11_15210, partial [Mesorhizobium sp.]